MALVIVGLWDQHPKGSRPPYELLRQLWSSEEEFVGNIEKVLPDGAMIYQLPYVQFPEVPRTVHFNGYDGVRFSLHSQKLRWSLGGFKGRETDALMTAWAKLPVDEQLRTAAAAGFQGVQVNRTGYEDNGAAIEAQLRELLGEPIQSPGGGELFFPMIPHTAQARGAMELR